MPRCFLNSIRGYKDGLFWDTDEVFDRNVMCTRSGLIIKTVPSVRFSRASEQTKNQPNNEPNEPKIPRMPKNRSMDFLSVITRYQLLQQGQNVKFTKQTLISRDAKSPQFNNTCSLKWKTSYDEFKNVNTDIAPDEELEDLCSITEVDDVDMDESNVSQGDARFIGPNCGDESSELKMKEVNEGSHGGMNAEGDAKPTNGVPPAEDGNNNLVISKTGNKFWPILLRTKSFERQAGFQKNSFAQLSSSSPSGNSIELTSSSFCSSPGNSQTPLSMVIANLQSSVNPIKMLRIVSTPENCQNPLDLQNLDFSQFQIKSANSQPETSPSIGQMYSRPSPVFMHPVSSPFILSNLSKHVTSGFSFSNGKLRRGYSEQKYNDVDYLQRTFHEFVYDNNGTQLHRCRACSKLFTARLAFNGHIQTAHFQGKNQCNICHKHFSRSWLLKGHMRTHTGERPYRCQHPGCDKAFADKSNLRSHTLIHTVEGKNHVCFRCNRAFAQKRYLHKHQLEVCKM